MKTTRILIVEDEALVALSIKSCLENAGYGNPWIASTAEEALGMLSTVRPDLVLMDVRLGGRMNGIEAAGVIRDTSRVPVVFLTAHSDPETLERAKLAEPFGYVLKPFDERALDATIRMALYKANRLEATRHRKEELDGILHSMGDGIVVTSESGAVVFLNSAARRLLGLEGLLAPDTQISALFKDADGRAAEAVTVGLAKVMAGEAEPSHAELISLPGDGRHGDIEARLDPIKGGGGAAKGVILTLRSAPAQAGFRRLVERELENATNFQKSLVPEEVLELDGLRMCGFLIAAGVGSGDIYNAFRIDGSHLGLYMADVMGHGIAASSTTFLLSRLLAPVERNRLAFLGADALSPRQVVGRLNELFADSAVSLFFTICYGVMDLERKKLKLLRAGHPYPLIARLGGAIEIARAGGYAVGLSPRLEAPETEYALEPGDRFYFYTDGLLDCMNAGFVPFSEDGLVAAIEETSAESLEESVRGIRRRIAAWHGSESFEDDVSLAAFELRGH
jgi:serine phosphatase RsbU (regulator of sigma subunit)/AmiR/NasT family two-component response regulator